MADNIDRSMKNTNIERKEGAAPNDTPNPSKVGTWQPVDTSKQEQQTDTVKTELPKGDETPE